jgi:hypothetical protein
VDAKSGAAAACRQRCDHGCHGQRYGCIARNIVGG